MFFTNDQFELLQKLEGGVMRDKLSSSDREILDYFDRIGLARPNVQIADWYYVITEHGKTKLQQELIRKENVRRKQEEKQQSLQNAAAEKADRKAENRANRVFQVALTFLNAFLSITSGILVEHFCNIVDGISRLADVVVKFFK